MDTLLEAAATTYPCPPGDTRHGLNALFAFHSWKHHHTITLHPLDQNPHRWTPENDAITAITIQQDRENQAGHHLTRNDPVPHPPASATLQDVFAAISAELQEAKAPQQPDDEMPQAPPPPTAQERPHRVPLAHAITEMELPLQHRTIPDRNPFTEPTTTRALLADRHDLLLTVQGDAAITPTEGDPVTAAPAHAVHIPRQTSSAPMTVHPVPTLWQAIVITYPPPTDHTHTWQQRWEDIRGDLLQEHLEYTPLGYGRTPHP